LSVGAGNVSGGGFVVCGFGVAVVSGVVCPPVGVSDEVAVCGMGVVDVVAVACGAGVLVVAGAGVEFISVP
jgi:hypothetical protein